MLLAKVKEQAAYIDEVKGWIISTEEIKRRIADAEEAKKQAAHMLALCSYTKEQRNALIEHATDMSPNDDARIVFIPGPPPKEKGSKKKRKLEGQF